MIFNENGFPKPTGATDWMDSAHLAGLMAFVDHEKMSLNTLREYTYTESGEAVRCPEDYSGLCPANTKNFTRDQSICLLAGYYSYKMSLITRSLLEQAKARGYRAQNTEKDVPGSTKKFPDGADILDPSHVGYMKICAGLKASWFERLWMLARIKIASRFSPLKEPNNIIVMSIVYGYADVLRRSNPQIYEAIRLYWCGWRNEPELAEMLIKKLKES